MPFCKKCGSELESSDAFCPMCGEKNDLTVSSSAPAVNVVNQIPRPVQPAPAKQEPSTQEPKTAKKNRTPIIIGLCAVVLALIGSAIFVVVKVIGKKNATPKIEYEYNNAYKYFEENAEQRERIPVDKSKNISAGKDVVSVLKERGFSDFPVTADYSMDGKLEESKIVSDTSSEKHPVYETHYVTSKNEVWVISVMDGTITAYPSSYNMEHGENVPYIISESKEIVSYDISTNSFYRTVPKDSVLRVRVVDRIDAKTLESINLEG